MKGKWNGFYSYKDQRIQQLRGFEKTNFEIHINSFDGKNFKGTVQDDVLTGGMKELGEIIGEIEKDTITFRKSMPTHSLLTPEGIINNPLKKHPTLYYFGKLSANNTEIVGTWKLKKRWFLIGGFFPVLYSPGSGNWKMSLDQTKDAEYI